MILTDLFQLPPNIGWQYAAQMGIRHGVVRLPEEESFDLANAAHWKDMCHIYEQHGIKPLLIEPMPNRVHEHIKRGDEKRDESIEQVISFLPIMASLGITTICMNFMAYTGWFRSRSAIPWRGGALVTGFEKSDVPDTTPLLITKDELWKNLTYFLKAVVPYAEKYGVRLALHPDDPPVERLGNVERILTSRENVDKALSLVPSDAVGVTLCQGCYAAMGEDVYDTIRHFCSENKTFFVHFRDVKGSKNSFCETFHDDGPTNMAKALTIYREYGYHGPVRVDHVPTMAGEDNNLPGYANVGRLYAVGYLKGMLDALGYPYQ
ncbi:MAG: mannonate dehydratase [Oscillospiraceae bacterium]